MSSNVSAIAIASCSLPSTSSDMRRAHPGDVRPGTERRTVAGQHHRAQVRRGLAGQDRERRPQLGDERRIEGVVGFGARERHSSDDATRTGALETDVGTHPGILPPEALRSSGCHPPGSRSWAPDSPDPSLRSSSPGADTRSRCTSVARTLAEPMRTPVDRSTSHCRLAASMRSNGPAWPPRSSPRRSRCAAGSSTTWPATSRSRPTAPTASGRSTRCRGPGLNRQLVEAAGEEPTVECSLRPSPDRARPRTRRAPLRHAGRLRRRRARQSSSARTGPTASSANA